MTFNVYSVVTIEVGTLDDGFYVGEDGTGIGLAIVARIADAHGWDVELTENEAGGARFELTGVSMAD